MQIVRNVSSQACLSSTNYNDYIFPSGGWAKKRGVNYRSLTPSSTFPRCTENSERYLIIKALCRDYCHFTFIASSSSSSSIASHKLTRTSQVLNWALRRFGIYRESASAGGWHTTTLMMRWASNQIQGLVTIYPTHHLSSSYGHTDWFAANSFIVNCMSLKWLTRASAVFKPHVDGHRKLKLPKSPPLCICPSAPRMQLWKACWSCLARSVGRSVGRSTGLSHCNSGCA